MMPRQVSFRLLDTMPTPCWEWDGHRDQDGYGITKMKGVCIRVNRLFYHLFVGHITPMHAVMHKCDNPPCCNPEHLTLGTTQENVIDCIRKGRHTFGERQGRSKMSDETVKQARDLYSKGWTQKRLAKKFAVSRTTIGYVVRKESWNHVR